MFDMSHSASRGSMNTCMLIIFKHDTALGNAPARKLFESVVIKKKPDVEYPRCFGDYTVEIKDLPQGVSVEVRD